MVNIYLASGSRAPRRIHRTNYYILEVETSKGPATAGGFCTCDETMHGASVKTLQAAAPLGIADSIGNEYCDKAESGVTDPEVSRSTFTWSNSAMELQTGRMLTEDYLTVIKHMEGVRIVREEMQETQEEHTAAE